MGLVDCQPGTHDFAFLRMVVEHGLSDYGFAVIRRHIGDRFYCRRCLIYVDRAPTKAPRDDAALTAPGLGAE